MKFSLILPRVLCAVLMITCAVPVAPARLAARGQDNRPIVYILRVKQEGKFPQHGDLSDFTGELLKLRITELKSFRVEVVDAVPRCDEGQKADAGGLTQVSLANEADFYALRSAIEVRTPGKPETEVVLDYELTKCVRREVNSLTNSKEPFAESEVLKYINSMADVVALLLERERTVTKMVAATLTTGSDSQSWTIANKLTGEVEAGLKQADDFTLREKGSPNSPPPDFTIEGRVSASNKVNYKVKIATKNGRDYPTKTVTGPEVDKLTDEKLAAFYKEATATALDYLKYVRYVAEARRNSPLSEEEAARMLDNARRLMCVGDTIPGDCKQQPETAILVLTEIKERKKATDFTLLGRAQMLVGEYLDAAESFDMARSRVANANPEAIINLLNQSGEAWFKAKSYSNAIARYEESLKLYNVHRTRLSASLSEEEARVQLQMARSYRYGNRGVEGLKVILNSWSIQRDTKEMNEELGYLIADLPERALPEAEEVLEAYKGQPQYKAAKPMLQNLLAKNKLLEILFMYGLQGYLSADEKKKAFDNIDRGLKDVEAIPATALSADARALQQTLRALWYREAGKDFAQALLMLEQAIAGQSEVSHGMSKFLLAETYYLKAQQPDASETKTLYDKASSVLKDLIVTANNPATDVHSAYNLFILVNHKLGKDKVSKEFFEERIKEKKEADNASLALSHLCTHYLFDLECALKNVNSIRADAASEVKRESVWTLAEIQLFRGEYAEAQKGFERPDNFFQSEPLKLFYLTWALFAQNNEKEAREVALEWKNGMDDERKAGRQVDAVLEGSRRALENEKQLTPQQKELLRGMHAAMTDKSSPLPPLP